MFSAGFELGSTIEMSGLKITYSIYRFILPIPYLYIFIKYYYKSSLVNYENALSSL